MCCSLANHSSSFKERKRRRSLRLLRARLSGAICFCLILRAVRSKISTVHLHVFAGGLRRLYNDQHWSRRNQLKQSEARRARRMHSRKILLLFVTFLVSAAICAPSTTDLTSTPWSGYLGENVLLRYVVGQQRKRLPLQTDNSLVPPSIVSLRLGVHLLNVVWRKELEERVVPQFSNTRPCPRTFDKLWPGFLIPFVGVHASQR